MQVYPEPSHQLCLYGPLRQDQMFSPCVVAYEHINKITQYIHALLTSKTHSKINNQWQDSKQRDGYITFAAAVGCIEQR